MTNNLILIPARSGSSRVSGKNLRDLKDRPLISHIITAAKESGIGRVVVSTDSREIASAAENYGAEAPFLRPLELSINTAPSLWCILHALKWFKENENWIPEVVAFCPPTNPFTKKETIANMYRALTDRKDINSIVTIAQPLSHPFTLVKILSDNRLQVGPIAIDGKTILDIERSQDWPVVWEGSAACRMTKSAFFISLLDKAQYQITDLFGKTYDVDSCIGYKIDRFESFDINDENDWFIAEQIIKIINSC